MYSITDHFGQPSYTLSSTNIRVFVTVKGGHMTANFRIGNRTVNPFFIAPWWKEAPLLNEDNIIQVLRGDFLCMPFGGNSDTYNGKKYPVHGETSNNIWTIDDVKEENGTHEIKFSANLEIDKGRVIKKIIIKDEEPLIYISHSFKEVNIKTPVGHHPNLKLPNLEGAGIIDISKPVTGFTPPFPVENPETGGYSRVEPDKEFNDIKKVPTIFGSYLDISRYPTPFGYEDIVLLISDQSKDFTYTAVSVPSEGYMYFQIKDPKVLTSTLFWMSNGGRHYSPWNGRIRSVIGIEEITAYFHYGIKPSVERNPLQKRGFKTYLDINDKTKIRLIIGMVEINSDFKGIEGIYKLDEKRILIKGRGGEEIELPCNLNFLYE